MHGAISASLFYEAGQFAGMAGFTGQGEFGRAVFHAGAGCISASIEGGNCGRGALAAGATKYIGSNYFTEMDKGPAGIGQMGNAWWNCFGTHGWALCQWSDDRQLPVSF